ncbi:MAG: hypothetical protein ACLSS9_14435 [Acutalibacteraceae bacterium]
MRRRSEVLVCSMDKPTMESAAIMQSHPLIRLLVCTGGPGVVRGAVLRQRRSAPVPAIRRSSLTIADIRKVGKDIITLHVDTTCPASRQEVFV